MFVGIFRYRLEYKSELYLKNRRMLGNLGTDWCIGDAVPKKQKNVGRFRYRQDYESELYLKNRRLLKCLGTDECIFTSFIVHIHPVAYSLWCISI